MLDPKPVLFGRIKSCSYSKKNGFIRLQGGPDLYFNFSSIISRKHIPMVGHFVHCRNLKGNEAREISLIEPEVATPEQREIFQIGERIISECAWFAHNLHYGFICGREYWPDGKFTRPEIFLHKDDIRNFSRELRDGSQLQFWIEQTTKSPRARNVVIL